MRVFDWQVLVLLSLVFSKPSHSYEPPAALVTFDRNILRHDSEFNANMYCRERKHDISMTITRTVTGNVLGLGTDFGQFGSYWVD
jgi:hypothetical protein